MGLTLWNIWGSSGFVVQKSPGYANSYLLFHVLKMLNRENILLNAFALITKTRWML